MLKIGLLFKKFTNFNGQITREFLGLRMQNFQGIVFIYTQTFFKFFQTCISVPLNNMRTFCMNEPNFCHNLFLTALRHGSL